MPSIRNAKVLFNEVPKGYSDPDRSLRYDESGRIDTENVELNGGVLVKLLYLAIDVYIRGRMRGAPEGLPTDAYTLGKPIVTYGVGTVMRSENPSYKAGDHIYGEFICAEYAVITDTKGFRKLTNEENIPLSNYLGVAGMPGKTAYFGWKTYAKPKKGETIFVTTGAGPVGSTVIQLAKLEGLKVIASAGSEEKVQFMKDIGADVAFNYKTESTHEILAKHGPIDIYWDHVGGEVLDIALLHAAQFARFLECGMIAGYFTGFPAIKNYSQILFKSITMQGFIANNLGALEDAFYKEIPTRISKGEIKCLEYAKHGLQSTGQTLLDVQKGDNFGKALIVVSDNN